MNRAKEILNHSYINSLNKKAQNNYGLLLIKCGLVAKKKKAIFMYTDLLVS